MTEVERKKLLADLMLCKDLIETAMFYLDVGRDDDLNTPLESLAEESLKLVDAHCVEKQP